jgi:hypothetical protein
MLPLPKFKAPRVKAEDCASCDARGVVHNCPNCECECEDCGGTGIVKEKISIYINGAIYNLQFIVLIKALPNIRFSADPPHDSAVRFVFDGGEGLLMPMRAEYARHIKTKRSVVDHQSKTPQMGRGSFSVGAGEPRLS